MTEILIALYDYVLGPADKFILSKGHSCWPLYVLLREKGFNPKLFGHPTRDEGNGIVASTGSEGHGFPIAVGIAMAKKITKTPGKVFVVIGDGECQEGTTWESMLLAAHHRLDNLVVIVDQNGIQGSGYTEDILPIKRLDEIARIIGWEVLSVDGHSMTALVRALRNGDGKPRMVIAKTVKGKGVGFMENNPAWHAKWPNAEEEAQLLEELK